VLYQLSYTRVSEVGMMLRMPAESSKFCGPTGMALRQGAFGTIYCPGGAIGFKPRVPYVFSACGLRRRPERVPEGQMTLRGADSLAKRIQGLNPGEPSKQMVRLERVGDASAQQGTASSPRTERAHRAADVRVGTPSLA
jgi:hypothetical protein